MARHDRGPARERQALDTFTKLMRATGSVRTRLEPHLLATGLTTSQFGIVEALLHLGPLSQRDLGAKLLVTKGNVSIVVDNLERGGWVRRTRDPRDGRRAVVRLTPDGRRRIARVFPQVAGAIVEQLSVLTRREQAALARLCRKLGLGVTRRRPRARRSVGAGA